MERVRKSVLYEFIPRPIEQASYLGSTPVQYRGQGEIRSETDILIPLGEDGLGRSIIVLYESKEEDTGPQGIPCHFVSTSPQVACLKNGLHYV